MGRKVLIALALVLAAGAYFVLDVRQRARLDRGTKRHRTDFTVYQYASRALVHGEDPYEARNPRGYRYVYPPFLAVLLMPIADWEPPDAALVFFLISAAGLAYAFVTLARLRAMGGAEGGRVGWQAVAVGAVVCLGFAHQGFQRGQITHVLLALQVAALADLLARRAGRAGLWLALGGALRLTPLLPAAAAGVGLFAAAVRGGGWGGPLRFGGGVLAGLLLGFLVVPVLALGWERANTVGWRWVEVNEAVYGANVDLEEEYRINEWRFKNQAPRRVAATWAGWMSGAEFRGERPLLDHGTWSVVNGLAGGTTLFMLALALLLGAALLRDPTDPRFPAAFAVTILLPVLMTRYAWPTHYLMALPAVVLAASLGRGGGRTAVGILLVGALLFYAAHAKPLELIGAMGVLMAACVLFLAFFLARASRRPAT